MTSLLSQFAGMSAAKSDEQKPETPYTLSGKTRSAATQAKYAEAFADGNTVANAAQKLGIGHVACLNQVYRYEKRGLMGRNGRDENTGGIYFFWNSK